VISWVRALAITSLLAILVLSLVPGAFRPHTMILPPGFEHVAAYAVAAFFLGLACHHRVPPVQLVLLLTAYGALLDSSLKNVKQDDFNNECVRLQRANR
jgi:hypothetical protein